MNEHIKEVIENPHEAETFNFEGIEFGDIRSLPMEGKKQAEANAKTLAALGVQPMTEVIRLYDSYAPPSRRREMAAMVIRTTCAGEERIEVMYAPWKLEMMEQERLERESEGDVQ